MTTVNQLNLFAYDDYRLLARDAFDEAKKRNPRVSLAFVGAKAGMSRMAVKYVLDGKRHLSEERANSFAHALGLHPDGVKYFTALVGFNKAKNDASRSTHLSEIFRLREAIYEDLPATLGTIGCFRRWFYPVLIEMSFLKDFCADSAWIAQHLAVPVPLQEISTALTYLSKSGLLAGGKLNKKKVKIPDSFTSHVYREYAAAQLKVAATALIKQKKEDREFSNLAISVNAERFLLAKTLIAEFRHKLHDLLASDEPCDRVIQINMQMFTTAATPPIQEAKT